ncbi:hypothetical protein pipiens_009507 [Culex pipiens pipiens]|uniref:Uncharacterized protein n=1 Tax=Culex pipiens pipiens TaxID=38569 RepID=A0ABD1DEA2_CULPP
MAFELRSDIEKYYLDPFRKAFQLASVVEPIGNFTKSILNEFEQPDEESEYMFIKRLKQLDLLSEPDLFTKDNQIRNEPQLIEDCIEGVMMPIQFQLRKFLESPGMYDCVMRSLNEKSCLMIAKVW